ncbi:MAG: hypothetical protein JWM86_1456 [Thermoleophilia bacterium]|nr:hypothetical protein [Thermoleophilia bacterium]
MHATRPDDLDPRRRARGVRRRDFMSRTATIPSLPQLLATVLVRLGLSR